MFWGPTPSLGVADPGPKRCAKRWRVVLLSLLACDYRPVILRPSNRDGSYVRTRKEKEKVSFNRFWRSRYEARKKPVTGSASPSECFCAPLTPAMFLPLRWDLHQQALHSGRVEAAFRMAVKENDGVEDDFHDDDDDDTDARRLTVEDRADLWEWFEEFVEDLSMDIAKVMSVRADHKAWVRNHGMGAHEADAAAAAVASAAASTAASGVSNSGGDRPQDLKSSDRKKRSNCHGKNPGGDPTATVDLRGAPQVERHQRQNAATAAAGGGGGGNAGSVVFAGGGSGAGVAGVGAASVGPALWAGAGAMGADGGALAHPEDQQRRDAWSAYYTQQQQQQVRKMMVVVVRLCFSVRPHASRW